MRKVIQTNQQTACLSALNAPACSDTRSRTTGQRVINTARLWLQRWTQRRRLRSQLRTMNTELLERDIGVPPGSFLEEAYKPFWRE